MGAVRRSYYRRARCCRLDDIAKGFANSVADHDEKR